MDDIRSWWEVPCIAHFCHSFTKPFHLPEFDIEELEDAILLDHAPTMENTPTSSAPLLVELYSCLLNGIVDKTITEDNWAFFLKLHLEWRCEYLRENWNPLKGDQNYRNLRARDKVEILHRLCHWRLELDDIGDLLRGMDGPSLRVESLGKDADGLSYWYFYGTRLYKEAPRRRRKKKPEAAAAKKSQKNEVATPGKRGRGKGGTPGGRGPTPGRKKKAEEKEETKKTPARRKKEEDQEEAESQASSHSPRKSLGCRSLRSHGSRGKQKEDEGGSEGDEEEAESSSPAEGRKRTPNNKKTPMEPVADDSQEDSGVEDGTEEDPMPEESRGVEPRRSGRRNKKPAEQEEEEEEEESGGETNVGSEGKEEDSDEGSEPKEEAVVRKASSTGWEIACSTSEEWEALVASLVGIKGAEPRRLLRSLEALLPDVLWLLQQQEREFKKKLLAELPRRTSDRIAIKAAQKDEQERLEALEREFQREELRKHQAEELRVREEEAEQKRQKRREDALQKRKVREEEQKRQRIEEEEIWTKALSGELSGPRRAAENVTESQQLTERAWELLAEDRDADLYTAMFKILGGLRKLEDSWVFEDPVTEAIAPGYFDVVEKPMDYATVEKKLEASEYHAKEEFVTDIELIFGNCVDYNGSDSEYAELAEESKKSFHQLVKKHFSGEEEVASKKRGRRRESRSPSACKTPELTSESSSEDSDSGSDESYIEGGPKKPKKHTIQAAIEGYKLALPRPPLPPPHPGMAPHPNPHLYRQYLQQQYGMRPPFPHEMGYRPPYSRMPPPYPPQAMRPPPDVASMYPPYPSPNHYPNAQMGQFRHPVPPHMPPHMMQHPAFMHRQPSGNPAHKGITPGPHGFPPHGMPPGQHGMPPGTQGIPPGPHGMPPGPHGMPPGPHGMPPGPHGMPPGQHGMPPGQHGMPPGPHGMPPGQHGMPYQPHPPTPGTHKQQRASPMSESPSSSPLTQRLSDSPLAQRPSMSPLAQRPPGSPAMVQPPSSPTVVRQPSSPSLKRQSSSPALAQQPSSPSLAQPSSSPVMPPAEEERGPDGKAEEGEEKAVQGKKEKDSSVPAGYGAPPNAYDMGRQAAYRYHQMMARAHHPQDPYAHYHGYGHPPPYPHSPHHPAHPPQHTEAHSRSREEAYYAWQQQMARYHHSAQQHPSHPGHSEAVARQRYWHEMEMRRQYAMMQQKKHHHGNIQHPQKDPAGATSRENILDYQDSLRKHALGLVDTVETTKEDAEKTTKAGKEEQDIAAAGKVDSNRAPIGTTEAEEPESGAEHGTTDEHGRQKEAMASIGAVNESKEPESISGPSEQSVSEHGEPKVASEEQAMEAQTAGASKQGAVSHSERPEGSHTASKGSSPAKTGVPPQGPLPPYTHHPPPYPMGPHFQNGYPSEAELARMHPYYHPPPHMMAPEMYPPQPFPSRHFEAEKHNGAAAHMNPNYAGYYGNRMPYYPPPYMHGAEHSGIAPQQMERWRAEMKQHQAMHGFSYPTHSPPHYRPMPTGDIPSHHPQYKQPLQPPTSTEHSGEPPAKKRRTSDS